MLQLEIGVEAEGEEGLMTEAGEGEGGLSIPPVDGEGPAPPPADGEGPAPPADGEVSAPLPLVVVVFEADGE
jgi:hypothetical protein